MNRRSTLLSPSLSSALGGGEGARRGGEGILHEALCVLGLNHAFGMGGPSRVAS